MAREKAKAKPKEEQLAGDAGTLEAEKKSPPPAGCLTRNRHPRTWSGRAKRRPPSHVPRPRMLCFLEFKRASFRAAPPAWGKLRHCSAKRSASWARLASRAA